MRFDEAVSFLFSGKPFLSCVPLCVSALSVCVFNWALRLHRIWPVTAQQTETLFSSHCEVSLSLFSSGNYSRDNIKVNNITSVRSTSTGTGREYITLKKGGIRAGGKWFKTSPFCPHSHSVLLCRVKSHHMLQLLSLLHSLVFFCSSLSCVLLSDLSFYRLPIPKGTYVVIPPISEGSAAWQPSSLLFPGGGCCCRARGEPHIDRRSKMRVQHETRGVRAHARHWHTDILLTHNSARSCCVSLGRLVRVS